MKDITKFNEYKAFFSEEDETVYHIMESGFKEQENRLYIVLREDPYQSQLSDFRLLTKEQIKENYLIKF